MCQVMMRKPLLSPCHMSCAITDSCCGGVAMAHEKAMDDMLPPRAGVTECKWVAVRAGLSDSLRTTVLYGHAVTVTTPGLGVLSHLLFVFPPRPG